MSPETLAVSIIGAIGTLLGGMWFMFNKLFTSQVESARILATTAKESQDKFLSHLEIKNGHTERIAKEFSSTVLSFQNNIGDLTNQLYAVSNQLERANTNNANIQDVLTKTAKALNEHHKHE